ncbi:MAG: cellulase family glycosylhydrolase [Ardenticatenaceae bacterium]|nr:cellulase family glycosylhydrolase [Anaerolineales bacterium]MCB8939754.1 cellulase family glycosylhydrolase [Ardenticatenaceae bacterium]MCB8975162.1 cellulase family glycosylhydrolase [Ardenticatenaceae bacterium]
MWKKLLLMVSGLLLVVALWPPVGSLYELTGEDNLLAQLRGVVHWVNTAVRPQPQLAPETIPDNTNVIPYGVNTFLEQEAEIEKRAISLQMASRAGFRFIRQEFVWEDIEIHGKGDFEDRRNDPPRSAWEKYDNIVDLAEAYDMEIIARLSNPPAWSRALPVETTGTLAPPDNYEDFGDFAAAVAERYNGRIRYFQLWNEPNGNGEWGNHQPVNPEQYTELLCTAYRRIKEVNPGAVVLAGALTPTVAINDGNLNDLIFLERMYAAGAAECFDVMSAQGYGLWSGALDQRLKPNVINYPHNLYLRDVMVRHGDADKPIWISELGWNVVPEGMDDRFGRVTPEQQARFAVEAYERAQSEWPWVGVVNYWFLKRKDESELDQSFYYFRLLDADFAPQPVYDALAETLPQAAEPELQAAWIYDWMGIRPYLFIPSLAILFFSLFRWLTPHED